MALRLYTLHFEQDVTDDLDRQDFLSCLSSYLCHLVLIILSKTLWILNGIQTKLKVTIKKHGISFDEAKTAILDPNALV